MIGFDQALSPEIFSVGVDKLTIIVRGHWRSNTANGMTLFDNSLHLPELDWFNRPSTPAGNLTTTASVEHRKREHNSTIKACKIAAHRLQSNSGPVRIDFTLNPTRTLAHLLSNDDLRQLAPDDFVATIAVLPTHVFFARTENYIARSLDGEDNWLPPTRLVREQMGRNYWDTFLPIFVDQVRHLCNAMLSEYPQEIQNAPTNVITLQQGVVEMRWGEVNVPNIECYFERFHSQAVAAVRRGGTAILAADHSNDLWRYVSETSSAHRKDDRFSVGIKLPSDRRLAIYAKLADRLRFEVRRHGKGNYSALPPPADGNMRLVGIINQERHQLLDVVIWPTIGELFAGSDHPQLHDVGELIDQICAAVAGDTEETAAVLKSLLVEGAISATSSRAGIISRLLQRGIVERLRIRRRDLNSHPARYVLKAPYRDIHSAVVDSIGQRLP